MAAMRAGAQGPAVNVVDRARADAAPLDVVLRLGIAAADGPEATPLAATPAVLVAAAQHDLEAERTIDVLTLAYEVELRIAATLGRSGWDTSCVAGVVAAAIGACLAAGATRDVLHNATGISGAQALGRRASTGTMLRAFSLGKAAANGYLAYLLAARGFTGPLNIFEAPRGYLHLISPKPDATLLTDGLGERWRVAELDAVKGHADGEILPARMILESLIATA